MSGVKNLCVALTGLSIAILTSILVLVYGWGLTPKNWFWIIGGALIGNLIAQLLIVLSRTK